MIINVHADKVLDNLLIAIVVLDEQSNIVYLNVAAEDCLGISGDGLRGKPLSSFFAESDVTPSAICEGAKLGESFTRRRAHWQLLHGRELTVDYSVTLIPELKQIIVEIQPLDRLLRISRDEAWITSQETTTQMLRSMAHEIKNPLGGIRGAAQLLSRELGNEDLEEFTKIIIDETDRLRNLTDRMLGPNTPIAFQAVNIHIVLEHVASVIRLESNGNLHIIKDYDPSIPDLWGDKEQLIQATLNIVRNALQALQENHVDGGAITLRTRVRHRYTIGRKTHDLVTEIRIMDNGPGIPPHLVEDIFFPMITGRAEGTGLGLSISQNLITRHKGLIECSSVPGKTVFAIYLPLGISDA